MGGGRAALRELDSRLILIDSGAAVCAASGWLGSYWTSQLNWTLHGTLPRVSVIALHPIRDKTKAD